MKPLILTVAIAFLGACNSTRPALADWDACLIDGAELSPAQYGPHVADGTGHVLYVNTEWGRSAFRTEYEFGSMLLELPVTLDAGDILSYPTAGSGDYREGGQILGYSSASPTGTVTVDRVDDGEVVFTVDLRFDSPDVDLATRGTGEVSEQYSAPLVSSIRGCQD